MAKTEKLTVTEDVKIPGTNIMLRKGKTFEFSTKDESSTDDRALMEKFAKGVDEIFDEYCKKTWWKVSVMDSFFVSNNHPDYVVHALAKSKNDFVDFEKSSLNPFCLKFKDVVYSITDVPGTTYGKMLRMYTFSKGKYKEGLNMNARYQNQNSWRTYKTLGIKDWYKETFPSDPAGNKLNSGMTFDSLFFALKDGESIDNAFGISNSLVRNRLFTALSEFCGISYDAICKKWIGEQKQTETIEIEEECQIPGTDIILEAGDRIVAVESVQVFNNPVDPVTNLPEIPMPAYIGDHISCNPKIFSRDAMRYGHQEPMLVEIKDRKTGKPRKLVLFQRNYNGLAFGVCDYDEYTSDLYDMFGAATRSQYPILNVGKITDACTLVDKYWGQVLHVSLLPDPEKSVKESVSEAYGQSSYNDPNVFKVELRGDRSVLKNYAQRLQMHSIVGLFDADYRFDQRVAVLQALPVEFRDRKDAEKFVDIVNQEKRIDSLTKNF